MKNYYNILNVKPNATPTEVKKAYNSISKNLLTNDHKDALIILTDEKKRKEYDAKLLKSIQKKEKFKKNKVKIYTGIAVLAVGGITLGACSSCSKKNNNKLLTPTPIATPTPTVTVKPTVTPIITPTVAPTNTPTPTVTPIPEVGMTSEEINEIADLITAENAIKGLNVDYNQLAAAITVGNLTSLSNSTIKEQLEDKEEVIKNSNKYIDSVANNNIFNNSDDKYIRISELVSNQTDKEILSSLEDSYLEYINNLNKNTLTNKDYQTLVTNIIKFYYRETNFFNTEAESDYDALSAGAKYLADRCIFPQFNISFYESEFMTDENEEDLRRLQLSCLDGGNYRTDLNCYINNVLEQKQMTK